MNSSNYNTPFWIKDATGTSTNFTVKILNDGASKTPTLTIYYSTDNSTWSLFGTTTSGGTISQTFPAGTKVYLSCTTNNWGKTTSTSTNAAANNNRIGANKNFSVGGNIMSLIYGLTFADNRKYTTFPDDTIGGIFGGLFYNQSIVDAGELVLPVTHSTSPLPASGVAVTGPLFGCYRKMFEGCTNLVNGPHIDLRDRGSLDLPYCFCRMFYSCTALKSLYINTVGANYRYNSMFNNSAGAQGGICYDYSGGPLSSAFPSARWTRQCITSMYIDYDRIVDWQSTECGRVWRVTDNENSVIYENGSAVPVGSSSPFYVENITDNNETLSIVVSSPLEYLPDPDNITVTVEYSTDNVTWSNLGTTSLTPLTLPLAPGDKVYLRSNTPSWGYVKPSTVNRWGHEITGVSKVGGNIMSLLYGSSFEGKTIAPAHGQYYTNVPTYDWDPSSYKASYTFYQLFSDNTNLIDASELVLPMTTLEHWAYYYMFAGCTNLVYPPNELPAITLTSACYRLMFSGCSSILYAPTISAYTLAGHCCETMFYNCTSLKAAPNLFAPELTTACYEQMFKGCTNLEYIKCLAMTNINTNGSTLEWLDGTAANGIFVKDANTTWPTSVSGIPSGWTVQNE